MAKGKHAVTAANRRYEAAVEHIDRITNELVEAKARARRHQRDAERVPGLEAEIERLHALCDANTSDQLERTRKAAEERVMDAKRDVLMLVEMLTRIIHRADGCGVKVLSPGDQDTLQKLGCTTEVLQPDGSANRALRRARHFRRTAVEQGDHNIQDNLRPTGRNVDRAYGGIRLPAAPDPGDRS